METNETTTPERNLYREIARERKAARIALLVATLTDLEADDVPFLTAERLSLITAHTLINAPSEETAELVRELLFEALVKKAEMAVYTG